MRNGGVPILSAKRATTRCLQVITPNEDDLNQTFHLVSNFVLYVQIFSSCGQLLFEAAAYHKDWAAEGLPAGLFYYLLGSPDGNRVKGWLEVVK